MFWNARRAQIEPLAGNWWCRLVKIPNKTLCFCTLYENYHPETSQAQHIQLARILLKPGFYLWLEMRGGRKLKPMAGNWWRQLVRIPYKTLCFCVVYENYNTVAAQAQHIQLQWKHTQNTMPETPRIIKPPGGGVGGGGGLIIRGRGYSFQLRAIWSPWNITFGRNTSYKFEMPFFEKRRHKLL